MEKPAYEIALASFKSAVETHCRRFREMDDDDVIARAIELVREAGIDAPAGETIGSLMKTVAADGSIEACALLIWMGADHEVVCAALSAVAQRSPDVTEGLQIDALTTMFEEYAEEEIAAGRMIKTLCPNTGQYLYLTVDRDGKA